LPLQPWHRPIGGRETPRVEIGVAVAEPSLVVAAVEVFLEQGRDNEVRSEADRYRGRRAGAALGRSRSRRRGGAMPARGNA